MSATGTARIKHNGRSGSADESKREFPVVYLVYCDSASDGAITACTAPGVPLQWTHYQTGSEYDIYSIARRASAKQVGATADGRFIWEVTVIFSTAAQDPDKEDPTKDPCDWPLEIDGDGEQYLDYPHKDLDGNVYEVKTGEPLQADARATPKNYAIINITKNQRNDPLPVQLEFVDTVNSEPYYGAAEGTLKLAKMRWQRQYHASGRYYRVTYTFHYRKPEEITGYVGATQVTHASRYVWFRQELNAGSYFYKPSGLGYVMENSKKKKFRDENGQPSSGPFKLKLDGTYLEDAADRIVLLFRRFDWKDFADLNL